MNKKEEVIVSNSIINNEKPVAVERTGRVPFISYKLLKKVAKAKETGEMSIIKTYSRASTVIEEFSGRTFGVYNGKSFIPVLVTVDMIGRKFGEFSLTRNFKAHGGDKKLKNAKKPIQKGKKK
jgi:small subunit ribosomal protein S19